MTETLSNIQDQEQDTMSQDWDQADHDQDIIGPNTKTETVPLRSRHKTVN